MKSSAFPKTCFECGAKAVRMVLEPFVTRTAEGLEITVPDVPLERCSKCGDVCIPAESAELIDAWIDRVTGRLTREELQAFLEQYELTQKQAEQILGLGEKMITRWLNGPARVSESMSNYIRLLMTDVEAFEILRHRRWTTSAVAEDETNYRTRRKR